MSDASGPAEIGVTELAAWHEAGRDFALLDVLHPEVSKGFGVEAAAAEYGLQREEVMAMGDNYNDLEMLQYAGTSVLMGNAETSLHELLREGVERCYVTTTNDEDGVAVAIEKFILNKNSLEFGV